MVSINKGGTGEEAIKYAFQMDLQANPIQMYATEDKSYYSGTLFYNATFDIYNSKTTSDGKNRDFDRVMDAVAVLRGADDLHDYDNTSKKVFYLMMSWNNFPPEIAKELSYYDCHQFITLTPSEAAALVTAMGYKPLE